MMEYWLLERRLSSTMLSVISSSYPVSHYSDLSMIANIALLSGVISAHLTVCEV